jgi:hypothetical protein
MNVPGSFVIRHENAGQEQEKKNQSENENSAQQKSSASHSQSHTLNTSWLSETPGPGVCVVSQSQQPHPIQMFHHSNGQQHVVQMVTMSVGDGLQPVQTAQTPFSVPSASVPLMLVSSQSQATLAAPSLTTMNPAAIQTQTIQGKKYVKGFQSIPCMEAGATIQTRAP